MLLRRLLRLLGWTLAGGFVLHRASLGDLADGSVFATVLAALLGVALILVGIGSAFGLDQTSADEQT